MGDLQDPKMELLYHIRAYFLGIFPYIALKNRPNIYGRYLQSSKVPVAWPWNSGTTQSLQVPIQTGIAGIAANIAIIFV